MSKYYVRSGELQVVLDAPDPLEAAKGSLLRMWGKNPTVDTQFYVDERGFRGPRPQFNDEAVLVSEAPEWAFPYASVVSDFA